MIIPHINYCISCWSQASETAVKPLKSLYNQAVKVLDKKTLRYHHCLVLRKYSMLNFDNLIVYANVRLVFKILNNIAPPPLKTFVQFCSEKMTRSTRSTSCNDCRLPKCSSAFAQTAFSFKGIKEWNKLPKALKLTFNLKDFSINIRKVLLNNQLCQHR